MLNYHDLKFIHLFMSFGFYLSLFGISSHLNKKLYSFLAFIFSLGLIVSGFVQIHGYGISVGNIPWWIQVKMALTLSLLLITFAVLYKFPTKSKHLIWIYLVLLFPILGFAIFRPI